MVVDKILETISFKQSKWFKSILVLTLKNEIRLKMNLKKTSKKYLITHFMEKTMENVRNRKKLNFVKKYEYKKKIKSTI